MTFRPVEQCHATAWVEVQVRSLTSVGDDVTGGFYAPAVLHPRCSLDPRANLDTGEDETFLLLPQGVELQSTGRPGRKQVVT